MQRLDGKLPLDEAPYNRFCAMPGDLKAITDLRVIMDFQKDGWDDVQKEPFPPGTVVWWSGSLGQDACLVIRSPKHKNDTLYPEKDDVVVRVTNGGSHSAHLTDLRLCDDLAQILKLKKAFGTGK